MSAREDYCVNVLREWLRDAEGRRFDVLCKLDELIRVRSAPDFLLSDGSGSIAVEIKRVTFLGHDDLNLAVLVERGQVTPLVPATGEPVTWGEVTTRGVRYTDLNTVIAVTLGNAAAKFRSADWADQRAVILDMNPEGLYDPSENLGDEGYWDDEDFRLALTSACLPTTVDQVFGLFDDELFLGLTR